MKRIIFTGLAALSLLPFNAAADVTVKLPAVSGIDSLEYYSMPISKMISAKSRAELGLEEGKVPVVNDTVSDSNSLRMMQSTCLQPPATT